MTFVKTQNVVQQSIDSELDMSVGKLRTQLKQEKQRINEEINNYPPPIPACDAQFNYLLEERARIFQALNDLEVLPQQNLTYDEDE